MYFISFSSNYTTAIDIFSIPNIWLIYLIFSLIQTLFGMTY